MITALAGGVGASKLLVGLARLLDPEDLTVVVNTGDDIDLHGLHISPDLDIVNYSLAGIVNETKGWGIKDDTFHCLDILRVYSDEDWFCLGDRDLATHLYRTSLLKQGYTLTEVTRKVCTALGVKAKILPMTDDRFETCVITKRGKMHFEEYMVKYGAKDDVLGIEFFGSNTAFAPLAVLDAIKKAEKIIICPSNPIVSIGTILEVKGVRDVLRQAKGKKIGVSPIIGGVPVKGPADKLLRGLGSEVSAFGVATLYADFLDKFIIDVSDTSEKKRIEDLGIKVKIENTLMRSLEDKVRLAKATLED